MSVELIKQWGIQLLAATFGSFGFSLLFGLKKKKLFFASIGGFISWLIYLVLEFYIKDTFIACFVAAVVSMVYSEILARTLKAPTTVFVFPSLVPLVPGSGLYYTMQNILLGDSKAAMTIGLETLKEAVALAFGIVIVMVGTRIFCMLMAKKNCRCKSKR